MNEWTKLLEDLEQDGPLIQERTDALKKRLKRESELRQKKWLIYATINCLLGLGILWWGGITIGIMEDTRIQFLGIVAMIIGFEVTVLAKLAYGGLFSLNKVVETVREVQVSIIEHLRAAEKHNDEEV